MAMNPIPPQAYTKDTLQKAYAWLLKQSPELKEMASNQEILVSLYLQAQRNGEQSLERPSIQNFRTELKSLAHMMGDFEPERTQAKAPSAKTSPTVGQVQASMAQASAMNTREVMQSVVSEAISDSMKASETVEPKVFSQSAPTSASPFASSIIENQQTMDHGFSLDLLDRTAAQQVREVRNRLNLSSDLEAVKAMLSIGYQKITKMLD